MRKRILIMDDEENICREICDFLVDKGYNAAYACNGHDGLAMIEKEVPSLLILDIRMPKINGLEVLRELTERFSHLPVVVISGFLDPQTTSQAIDHGAAMCIDKPVKLEDLHDRVIVPLIGPGK